MRAVPLPRGGQQLPSTSGRDLSGGVARASVSLAVALGAAASFPPYRLLSCPRRVWMRQAAARAPPPRRFPARPPLGPPRRRGPLALPPSPRSTWPRAFRPPAIPPRPRGRAPRARANSSPGSAAPGGGQRSDGGASFLDDGLPALSGSLRTLRGLLTWIGTKSTVRLLMSLENIEREVAARLRPLPRAPGIRGPRRSGSPTPPALGSGAGRWRGAGRAG